MQIFSRKWLFVEIYSFTGHFILDGYTECYKWLYTYLCRHIFTNYYNMKFINTLKMLREIMPWLAYKFIYLFVVLRHFQHCTGHITTGSWKGRGNQYIQFIRVLYCKLPTNGKQLPAFPLEAMPGTKPRPQRWEARMLPLCHHAPPLAYKMLWG